MKTMLLFPELRLSNLHEGT